MSGILMHHKQKPITYEFDDDANTMYEQIVNKFNDQYNLKYTSASQVSASQPDLNMEEKSELSVRTKATEIIGRLSCILWIYCNGKMYLYLMELIMYYAYNCFDLTFTYFISAFQSVLEGKPCTIPAKVTAEYVRRAEEIADMSYAQSETFSSVSIISHSFNISVIEM